MLLGAIKVLGLQILQGALSFFLRLGGENRRGGNVRRASRVTDWFHVENKSIVENGVGQINRLFGFLETRGTDLDDVAPRKNPGELIVVVITFLKAGNIVPRGFSYVGI